MSGLDVSASAKPLDVGNGLLCASFGRSGFLLSLGMPHPEHGFVELNALPPFDEAMRGNPAATRRYRERMTREGYAIVGLTSDTEVGDRIVCDPSDPQRPRWSGRIGGLQASVEAWAEAGRYVVRQHWRLTATDRALPVVRLWAGGRLDRPALAEITELDPPPPTGAETRLRVDQGTVRLEAPLLPAVATIRVIAPHTRWRLVSPGRAELELVWPSGASELAVEIEASLQPVAGAELDPPVWERLATAPIHPSAAAPPLERAETIVQRALTYVRGCTALRVAAGERAILTDHRVLPLSWTRDGYWQALALLAAGAPADRGLVADHLRWLWRRCERPDGRWVRSHHANGRRKDLAFQADQQLYPLVELADYFRLSGSLPPGVDWDLEVGRAWEAALGEADPATGFMASAENAADDPAAAGFITAAQILLWYSALRLAELASAGALGLPGDAFRLVARKVRASFDEHIGSSRAAWPYAVDAAGQRIAYHDANDLPVALAPLLGFCPADDPGWRATMDFAFSPANPGWADGRRAGLGSAHTPGPWTLGDIQAWVRARVTGNAEAAADALSRLEEVAFVDGMLPEAYDADGDARIRHWFAWPGAALAALRLLDRAGRLEHALMVSDIG